jgi:hypothetical protein
MLMKKRWWAASIAVLAVPLFVLAAAGSVTSCTRSTAAPAAAGAPAVGPPDGRPGAAPQADNGCRPLDEFVPTPGDWRDLIQDYASEITGTDITQALQHAFDDIANASIGKSGGGVSTPVLYIRPGVWTLAHTVTLYGAFAPEIVGDDPTTTVIQWAGATFDPTLLNPQDVDMIHIVDSTRVKWSRLTLDGANEARIAVQFLQSTCSFSTCTGGGGPGPDGGPDPDCGETCTDGDVGCAHPSCTDTCAALQTAGQPFSANFPEFDDDVFTRTSFGVIGALAVNLDTYLNEHTCSGFYHTNGFSLAPPFPVSTANLASGVIRRSKFQDVSTMAFALNLSNSLDWLIEDSEFTQSGGTPTGVGVWIDDGSSVTVLNSRFVGNDVDLYLATGTNAARGNASTGSNTFLEAAGHGPWISAVEATGNYVQTVGAGGAVIAEEVNLTLLDNYFDTTLAAPGGVPPVQYHSHPNNITHGGNSVRGPYMWTGTDPCTGQTSTLHWIQPYFPYGCDPTTTALAELQVGPNGCDDATATPCDVFGAAGPSAGGMAAGAQLSAGATFAPKSSRPVTYVTTDTTVLPNGLTLAGSCNCPLPPADQSPVPCTPASTCADAINGWLALQAATTPAGTPGGELYFPYGLYHLRTTIEIPAGLDVVLAGKGLRSLLSWVDAAGGGGVGAGEPFMIHMSEPAVASVRDLSFVATEAPAQRSRPGGILIDSADDANGLVYVDTGATSYAKSALDVAGLDNVLVWIEAYGGADGVDRQIGVIGGGSGAQGSSHTRGVVGYAGGGGGDQSVVTLKNWGKAVLIDLDNENPTQGLDLDQTGYLTLAGGRMITNPLPSGFQSSYPLQSNLIIESTFRGNATFMNLDSLTGILSTAARQAQVLSLGNLYDRGALGTLTPLQPVVPYCQNGTQPTACPFTQQQPNAYNDDKQMALFDVGLCGTSFAFCADQVSNPSLKGAFTSTMLADLRATPAARPSTCGQTDVRLHRLFFSGGTDGDPKSHMRAAIRVQRH